MTDHFVDAIIASTGVTREQLDSAVADWRYKSFHLEFVQAKQFNVEELAAAVEQLATRLARIQDIAGGYTQADDAAGKLGRRIFALASPEPVDAVSIVASDDRATQSHVYGYPALAVVREPYLEEGFPFTLHRTTVVHHASGKHTETKPGESIEDACSRFEGELK